MQTLVFKIIEPITGMCGLQHQVKSIQVALFTHGISFRFYNEIHFKWLVGCKAHTNGCLFSLTL